MRISVVIPAYNEQELLPSCLAAVLPQVRALAGECIVVDNTSTDRTADIARQAGCRVIHEPRPGVVFALQRGLHEATGDIVAFTDADTVIGPRWLEVVRTGFSNQQTVAITGPVVFAGFRLLSAWRFFYRSILLGSNMAVRRTDGIAVGGFDARYNLASDIAFGWALRSRGMITYLPAMRVTTSSRRFQAKPFSTGFRYVLNHLWMVSFHRPLFWHFTPIRTSLVELECQNRRRTWFIGTVMFLAIVTYLSTWPGSSVFGQIVTHGPRQGRVVALTFDDGPNGAATRSIVDILTARHIPATFFEVGRSVVSDPDSATYIVRHGLSIGNHSWDHSFRLPYRTPKRIHEELVKTNDAIIAATGQVPSYFRPPHGLRSPQLLYETRQLRLRVIDWSVDPYDYLTGDPKLILHRIITRVRPGAIILMHDGLQDGPRMKPLHDRHGTIAALPLVIDALQQRGYTFVSLDALLSRIPRDDR